MITYQDSNICSICGGWSRQLPSGGAHFLCIERQKLGLPTPNLGMMCPECKGSGHFGRSGFGMFIFLNGNSDSNISRTIDAVFRECSRCHGGGIVSVESIEQTEEQT